jgi:hypothetical protein
VSDPKGIQGIIYAFYRGLMGSEEPKTLSLQQNIWSPNMQVNAQENEDLLRSFTMEELEAALKDTKTDTDPGPDGLPVLFYKKF